VANKKETWDNINRLIVVVILATVAYLVIVDTNQQVTEIEEQTLKQRVIQNSQTSVLVAQPNYLCPYLNGGQFVGSDHNCNVCHTMADVMNKLSKATHHYTNIQGIIPQNGFQNVTTGFLEPALPGYVAMLPGRLNQDIQRVKVTEKIWQEGHWIGLEVGPLTPALAQANGIPQGIKGVLVDEVTLLAAASGIIAGDVITAINDKATGDLYAFKEATRPIAMSNRAVVTVYRGGQYKRIDVISNEELGLAQMEAAPMINATDPSPHGYYGACEKCHAIAKTVKNTGQMAKDGGDVLTKKAPPIKWGVKAPHGNRGVCVNCHTVIQ